MRGFYKMLLLWFPGNRPLHCDSLGDCEVNFHCYSHFSGVSSLLVKGCWLIRKKEQWDVCVCEPCRCVKGGSQQGGLWAVQESGCGSRVSWLVGWGRPPRASLSPLRGRWQYGLSLAVMRVSESGFCLFRCNTCRISSWAVCPCGSLSWELFSVDAQKGDGYCIHDLIKKTLPLVICTLFNHAIFRVFPQRARPDMCVQSQALTTWPPCSKSLAFQ